MLFSSSAKVKVRPMPELKRSFRKLLTSRNRKKEEEVS